MRKERKKTVLYQNYHSDEYLFSIDEYESWNTYLKDNGFVVIKDILEKEEYENGLDLYWKMMTNINRDINRNDRSTWNKNNFPPTFRGICSYYGICQSDFAWYLRKNNKIQDIFSKIHDCTKDELCTSMDAINMMYSKENYSRKLWLHEDQAKNLVGGDINSVQGAYNFYPVNEKDSGLLVVPKSHLNFEKRHFMRTELPKQHYCELDKNAEENKQAVKLILPSNVFVLWNSRTLHCNADSLQDRSDDSNNIPCMNRVTNYIAMLPKKYRSEQVLEDKKKLYLSGRGSTHWANFSHKKPFYPRYKKYPNMNILPISLEDGHIPSSILSLL